MEDLAPRPATPPELLAPAGDLDCARAAVENGADAVYFGLRSGLNARARAVNFSLEELPEFMAYLHLRGVKGYVTLNTLVFAGELSALEQSVRAAVAAGVDAVLVQDLGAVRFIHALVPDWPIHASTQMSLTSAEGIRVAESLGIRRVVLARELSIAEIRQIRAAAGVELEVFVHGALCMSYSGQCLASFALGGRSGNRGQCAQACRLPFQLSPLSPWERVRVRAVDTGNGVPCSTGPHPLPLSHPAARGRQERGVSGSSPPPKFLLSPQDLAAYDLLPELIEAGVRAIKIEGRMKSAEYVAAATRVYRRAIDEALAGRRLRLTPEELAELEGPFSRGFSHGWLAGRDDRQLVSGDTSAKRGVSIGRVQSVRRGRVTVELTAAVKRGDGLLFEPEPGDKAQGGRVYEVFLGRQSIQEAAGGSRVELAFGRDALDPSRLRPDQNVLKTDDPQLGRRLRKTYEGRPRRRVPLDLTVEAGVGRPLAVLARAGSGAACRIESPQILEEAVRHPLTPEVLAQQLGRLGGSVYELRNVEARIDGRPMVPLSVLGQLRHELVRQLDAAAVRPRACVPAAESPVVNDSAFPREDEALETWHILCRDLDQLDAVLALGATSVIAEFADLALYAEAVARAQHSGAEISLATPRIQKPGEAALFPQIAGHRPDGLLVRNLAGAAFCAERQVHFVADAALHAANPWTVAYLHELGARRVTAAYDLDRQRLLELAAAVSGARLEVVVHQHLPMFHTEYCVVRAPKVGWISKSVLRLKVGWIFQSAPHTRTD